ncbi:MAG: hypothetical protein QM564_02355 [Bergeyella sp.]
MKKIFFALMLVFVASVGANAQYAVLNSILERLEERKGIKQDLENVSIDDKKFILVKDFEDHTERNFVVIKGDKATYVEVFDDKASGESTSNVFSGDVVRSRKNVISLRCDMLEGKKVPIPVTKTFLLMRLNKIIYLVDTNTGERWIDEKSFGKGK